MVSVVEEAEILSKILKDTLERVVNEIDITVKGIVTPRYGFLNVAK